MDIGGINDLEQFWHELRSSSNSCLLLDYDGTLAPFRVERDLALPYAGVIPLLDEIIANNHCRLILISGRQAGEVFNLLGGNSKAEIWGCHGGERRLADGNTSFMQAPAAMEDVLNRATDWAESQGFGHAIERKPLSIAFHNRGLAKATRENITQCFVKGWQQLTDEDIELHPFDGGIELRCRGIDKGLAVQTIINELEERTVTAYLGDDKTDEDAFTALGDRGLPVLVRPAYRPTAATHWLKPPDELLVFLRRWVEALHGKQQQQTETG